MQLGKDLNVQRSSGKTWTDFLRVKFFFKAISLKTTMEVCRKIYTF